jgi:hypothetical protein
LIPTALRLQAVIFSNNERLTMTETPGTSRRGTQIKRAVIAAVMLMASPLNCLAVNYTYSAPTAANPTGTLVPRADYYGTNSMRNGLPPTMMDSFVNEAMEHKEAIYGDEGTNGPPPYMLFTEDHRINTGILDQRDAGLTTGHGSFMPDGVGKDEFLGLEESQSGARGVSAADGFYNGVSYRLPSAYAADPAQFPLDPITGEQYNTLLVNAGQINESRWGTPPPIAWNNSNPAPYTYLDRNGDPKTVPDTWTRSGNGWTNALGDRLSDDGTMTYGTSRYAGPGIIQIAADTVVYPDGSQKSPKGKVSSGTFDASF